METNSACRITKGITRSRLHLHKCTTLCQSMGMIFKQIRDLIPKNPWGEILRFQYQFRPGS